ncbi:MAG: hypothetical protein M1828_001855 [Chrysothrix sp. TS-e1954]|nr:MAG: hypothetical protein M1828_001855 [Chrysothrix sp. TS-e1954]
MATTATQLPVPAHELFVEPNAQELPKLRGNYGRYFDPSTVGWMQPTTIDTPVKEIRHRFESDGYVWMKNVIPREDVLDMREHYFEHMSPTGILKPGTSPRDGIFNPDVDPLKHSGVGGSDLPEDILKVTKLTEAHAQPVYQAFLEHPQLRQFIRDFMGWEKEMMVVRNLLRHNVPNGLSTGVHYDKIFLRGGDAEFLTAWIPIGDVSAAGGGLTYLENSTKLGQSIEASFLEASKDFTPEERVTAFNKNMMRDGQLSHNLEEWGRDVMPEGRKWLVANYEAGDVVFHNPYFIHGALKNEDPKGRIRLGSDVRFYEEGADYDKRWMQIWAADDGL